jgi:CRISPR/Cas system CSM-associated protein Csm2 small subunit
MSKKYITLGSLFKAKDNDNKGRPGYYIKLDKDVELVVNGKKVTRDTISVKNVVTKFEEMIDRTDDEEKIEKYENTKARFEKDGDLNYIKQELTVVID